MWVIKARKTIGITYHFVRRIGDRFMYVSSYAEAEKFEKREGAAYVLKDFKKLYKTRYAKVEKCEEGV